MRDRKELTRLKYVRCIVTYNDINVDVNAAMKAIRDRFSSLAPPIRIRDVKFSTENFTHLGPIGSSIIDLTKEEFESLKRAIPRLEQIVVEEGAAGDTPIQVVDPKKSPSGQSGETTAPLKGGTTIPTRAKSAAKASAEVTLPQNAPATPASTTLRIISATDDKRVYLIPDVPPFLKAGPQSPPLSSIKAINADIGAGRWNSNKPIKVAVLDTGIDSTHPRFIRIDGSTKVLQGKSYIPDVGSLTDDHGHGTSCAGIIAGGGNYGVAPGATLYSVKVLDKTGEGWLSDVLEGLNWVTTTNQGLIDKIDIVSMSLELQVDGEPMPEFVNTVHALRQQGCVVVAGTGNSGEYIRIPANTPALVTAEPRTVTTTRGVVAVGAVDNTNACMWSGSAHKPNGTSSRKVTVVAPGENITTTKKGGGYAVMTGTSAACAYVSGAVALIMNKIAAQSTPAALVDATINKLIASASPGPLSGISYSTQANRAGYGKGLIDCDKATKP